MDTGREERVNKAACITGNTEMGARVFSCTVRPVGCGLQVARCLVRILKELSNSRGFLGENVFVEVPGACCSGRLLFGRNAVLLDGNPNRNGAIVQRNIPGPAASILFLY